MLSSKPILLSLLTETWRTLLTSEGCFLDGSSSAIGARKTAEVNLPFKGGTIIKVRKLTEDTTEIMPTTREVCCNKSEWPLKPSAHRSKNSSKIYSLLRTPLPLTALDSNKTTMLLHKHPQMPTKPTMHNDALSEKNSTKS